MFLVYRNYMAIEFALTLVMHKGIIAIVRAIGTEKIQTRDLYRKIPHSHHKDLKKAEALGLIEREKVKPEGKGNWPVYNKLTLKGKKLLEMSRKYEV